MKRCSIGKEKPRDIAIRGLVLLGGDFMRQNDTALLAPSGTPTRKGSVMGS